MEELGRKYLTNVEIKDGYLNGYTEDEGEKDALISNINVLSKGFCNRYAVENENEHKGMSPILIHQ